MNRDEKKLILIASGDSGRQSRIEKVIHENIGKCVVFAASDGSTALSKIQNAPPHLLISDMELAKLSGLRLVQDLLATRGIDHLGFVLIGSPPKEGVFVDEIVTGRVQLVDSDTPAEGLISAIAKALSFRIQPPKSEFAMKKMKSGEVLMREGDKADFVYLVKSGELRALKKKDSKEVLLGAIQPGEFAGELAYITGEGRNATVVASSDCELIQIPIGTFDQVLFKRPAWSKALLTTLAKRIKNANHSA